MKLLKAIEKEKIYIEAVLEFDKPFDISKFSFGILSLERKDRSLYLDVVESYYVKDKKIILTFEYDEDILCPDVSKRADLRVQDLILGLDEAKLYIGEDDYNLPSDMYLLIEGDDTELEIGLKIK